MKPKSAGALSGCLVWVITFGLVSLFVCPISMVLAGAAPVVRPEAVARVFGPRLCPEGTAGEIYTYDTTSIDDYGFEQPTTGYELHCVGANGQVEKNLGASFGFILVGTVAVVALAAAAGLAFLLAAPVGALIGRFVASKQADP